MGKDNRPNLLATTIVLPAPCQRNRLSDIIDMVVVDRPPPKSKKRPVAAGLFLCLVHIPSPPLDNIRGLPQPRLAERANAAAIGETQN